MKFDKLSKLETIENIKPVDTIKPKQKVNLLDVSYLLNYTATILLYQMRILRNEIVIKDRAILKEIENEALKVTRSLINDNLQELEYTKKDINSFYKEVGIKEKV
ncbi:hypothetical protein [Aliarcobacter cryaerophilus]|uniref:hypothetical protein n=1 Tax=Aliarcobacter cryaerophilus TaxID=28198 RepID=UPI0021B4F006|nr:hypothetical protein [Aliarcobacter cryaerophilus]MCT7492004.1 hypothetical protein [Aliarcobacter cryaerophilus]